jgi:hypothetical protein
VCRAILADGFQAIRTRATQIRLMGAGSAPIRDCADWSARRCVAIRIEQSVSAATAVYAPEVIVNDRVVPRRISAHS